MMLLRYACLLVLACLALPSVGAGNHLYSGTNSQREDYRFLVAGLPWEFDLAREYGAYGSQTVKDALSINYVSRDSVHDASQDRLHLRAELSITHYHTPKALLQVWNEIRENTHPDTGLSYAWDYLLSTGERVYHLHAACTFTEEFFQVMMVNLSTHLGKEKDSGMQILCRCGSGCLTIPE